MDTAQPPGRPLPERIIIVRALPGLGDLLCVVPALRALRAALPRAQVALLGLPAARPVVERFPHYIDELVEFPGFPGLPETEPDVRALPAFFSEMHSRGFDLALQMHGSGLLSNPLTVMLGARHTAGFYTAGHYCPDEARFLPYVEGESEVRLYLRLMEFLGIPAQGEHLEFPVTDEDAAHLAALMEAHRLTPGEYVCIHAGAKDPTRRWPAERFAQVADALAGHGLGVVLTGSSAERDVARQVAGGMEHIPVDVTGRTGLGTLAALLLGARLLVCNDTGVSHLAAALGVPSVVVFTGSDPRRWAPLNSALHVPVGSGRGEAPGAGEVLMRAEGLLRAPRSWHREGHREGHREESYAAR